MFRQIFFFIINFLLFIYRNLYS